MSLSIKIKGTLGFALDKQMNPFNVDLEIEIPKRGFAVLVSAITSGTGSGHKSVADVLRELND